MPVQQYKNDESANLARDRARMNRSGLTVLIMAVVAFILGIIAKGM